MNNIVSFLLVVLIIASIIAIPLIFNSKCDEDCFREKFKSEEAEGIFVKYEMRGRTTTSKYAYLAYNTLHYINVTPIADSEQEGDKFIVLYDLFNPDNAILLRNRPILPDSLIEISGLISYLSKDSETNSVITIFDYMIEGQKIKRLQYIPIQYFEVLKEKYDSKSEVTIQVYTKDPRRSFLNVSSL